MDLQTLKGLSELWEDIKDDSYEMCQLKSDFDIEKYTCMTRGPFIAHVFHFLMRQYYLTVGENTRHVIDCEEMRREITRLKTKPGKVKCLLGWLGIIDLQMVKTRADDVMMRRSKDLEIIRLENDIEQKMSSIVDRAFRMKKYEELRKKCIEINGGPITNEQYQAEEPEYWKFFLQRKALWQHKERQTGISQGVWENIDNLEQKALCNEKFQVKMLDDLLSINLTEAALTAESGKQLGREDAIIQALRQNGIQVPSATTDRLKSKLIQEKGD